MKQPERVRVIESAGHDPWFNLALEEWLFASVEPGTVVVYVWRNAATVVIGRHQNPWVECRVDAMERDGIRLARRASGGGAVFHDLGNTNFTFATHRPHYDQAIQVAVILDALDRLGIDATFSGRNDILVEGRKVSGSAYFGRRDRWLHHGTLLIDADLSRLSHYLTVPPAKIESKGVQSVRSRVANLSEFVPGLDHDRVRDALLDAVREAYGRPFEVEVMDPLDHPDSDELAATVARYTDDAWRFGRTPAFTHRLQHRFPWGGVDLHLDVKRNTIRDVELFSDALSTDLVRDVVAALTGAAYRRDDLAARLRDGVDPAAPHRAEAESLARWLADALPA